MRSIMSSALLLRKTCSRFTCRFALKQEQSFFHSSTVSSASTRSLINYSHNTSNPSSLFSPFRFASTSIAPKKVGADQTLTQVIQSEIQCAQESEVRDPDVLPSGFPFEIIDNPGEQTITLKRKLGDETIEVEVHMPQLDVEEEEDDEEDNDNDENKSSVDINISLIVNVAKQDGSRLEFCCVASAEEITIDSMQMKESEDSSNQNAYEGPPFTDLDEDLQKAFYEYLEVRGIKSTLTEFLQEYMMFKDNREYLAWLKNMKDFVEK